MMSKKIKHISGQRSPRWALWARMMIPCENGLMYLARLRIIQTPWFGIYLHDIYEPDADRDPHNHPWSFISIVLRGHYIERVWEDPIAHPDVFHSRLHARMRWSWHKMGRKSAHRITEAAPGLKTLILVGPRRSNWGFFTADGYVPWQDYGVDAL
jgi:hypothetical protein